MELTEGAGGFLRQAAQNYLPAREDAVVPASIARDNGLRDGSEIEGLARDAGGGRRTLVEVQKAGDEPVGEKLRLIISRGDDKETFETAGRNQPLNLGNVKTAVKSKLIEILDVSAEALQESSIQLSGGRTRERSR